MDAPKCRLCGSRHWQSEPHVFKAEVKEVVNRMVRKPETMTNKIEPMTNSMTNTKSVSQKYKYRDADKWRAYMKEYMRGVRARKRNPMEVQV